MNRKVSRGLELILLNYYAKRSEIESEFENLYDMDKMHRKLSNLDTRTKKKIVALFEEISKK